MDKRGPRPAEKRLRDGAKQIEDKTEALKVAQEALHRVESEIAKADDEESLTKLVKKKTLIEKSIKHLRETSD